MGTDEKVDTCDPNQLYLLTLTEQVFCCPGDCNKNIVWVNWYPGHDKITRKTSDILTHNYLLIDQNIVKLSDEEFFLRFVIKGNK